MKKVVYNVTRYRKDELIKISGLGYITDEDLIIACISQNGKPYIRVFQDCIKDCHPMPDKPGEYKGATYEIREVQIDTGKDNYETREIELEYKQRIVSTVAKTPTDEVIFGFEYAYDDLRRVVEEKVLAYSTKMCYTYDSLDRIIKREIKSLDNDLISEENFEYDAAGNIVGNSNDTSLAYDFNNRLIEFANASTYDDTEGTIVHYDADGNMLSYGSNSFTYDSSNRLISANGHTYTYTASNVRIKDLCEDKETIYTYNTNCKLSKLLTKTTNNVVTKYVYGRGLIGEEVNGGFKTYHFDFRGSTIAITDESCIVCDTFVYDTYGKIISRTGSDDVIFAYNGRDGVITEPNGLVYMRARYYSPTLKRFINADIIAGSISNSITINRFAYANGNPVSNIDPFGLSSERVNDTTEYEIKNGSEEYFNILCHIITENTDLYSNVDDIEELVKALELMDGNVQLVVKGDYIIIKGNRDVLANYGIKQTRIRADNINKFKGIDDLFQSQSFKTAFKSSFDTPGVIFDGIGIAADTIYEVNQYESTEDKLIVGTYTAGTGVVSSVATAAASAGATALASKAGAAAGTVVSPGVGTAVGLVVGFVVGVILDLFLGWIRDEYIEDIVENN